MMSRLRLTRIFSWGMAIVLVSLLIVGNARTVWAANTLPQDDIDAMNGGWEDWKIEGDTCGQLYDSTGGGGTASPTESQAAIAKVIIGIAKTENLGQSAALIGLMVAIDESGLKIYANANVPVSLNNPAKQAVGTDHDSVGVFQQRPSTGWSTIATGPAADSNQAAVWQLMDPAYSAEAFFGSPAGSSAPPALSKGLQNVAGWQTMQPWVAAQKVQISGDSSGLNYQRHMAGAQALLSQYWSTATAVPLPVSFNQPAGSGAANDIQAGLCSSSGQVSLSGSGYVNPFRDSAWGLARTDQGVDYIPNKPLPVVAIGDGKVLGVNGPGWPGGIFIYYKLTSGPLSGKCVYVAEHLIPQVAVGDSINAGQTIATALPGSPWTEWGWAQSAQTPSVPYNGLADGTPTEGGKAFARFLRGLGASTRDDPGPGPNYAGATCK